MTTSPERRARFVRLAETSRVPIRLTIDGAPCTALAGDTILTALLCNGLRVRDSEFGDATRAGFCLMSACQDCWVWDPAGVRLRACTTPALDGMTILTREPESSWPRPGVAPDVACSESESAPSAAPASHAPSSEPVQGAVSRIQTARSGAEEDRDRPRIVIVGAGPAGVRAAEALVDAGVRPIVLDEGRRDGGQIYRRQPERFTRSYATLYGTEEAKAAALHRAFDALRDQSDYRPETLVWNVTADAVHTIAGGVTHTIGFDALILCAGATDRLLPIAGWNLAGCYSLGAAQIALKSQACAIGSRTVFVGTGPLLYLVAAQYVKAGARVAAVLDTSPAPGLSALRALAARPRALLNGIALRFALSRAGVRIEHGVVPVAIDGDRTTGVRGISFRDTSSMIHRIDGDAIALGWHLRAETQLADLARCAFAFEPQSRQWLPKIDADGRSSVRGVYLAGDGARVLGADGAEAAGRLAALAALADLGHEKGSERHAAEAARLRGTLAQMDAFRAGLARTFPWPYAQAGAVPDAAIVCRCEAITAGELRRAVTECGSIEINRAKAFSRVGMGRCQGRYCGHAAAELIAHAAGIPVEAVGRVRTQAPVKPVVMDAPEAGPLE